MVLGYHRDPCAHTVQGCLLASGVHPKSIGVLAGGGPTVFKNLVRFLFAAAPRRVFAVGGVHGPDGTSGATGAFEVSTEGLEAADHLAQQLRVLLALTEAPGVELLRLVGRERHLSIAELQASPMAALAPVFKDSATAGAKAANLPIVVAHGMCDSCFNPARAIGPCLVAAASGWGTEAFKGLAAYVLGPLVGALGGALAHRAIYEA